MHCACGAPKLSPDAPCRSRTTSWTCRVLDTCVQPPAIFSHNAPCPSPQQKLNHFPGMLELARKKGLARNLGHMRVAFPQHYDFHPA